MVLLALLLSSGWVFAQMALRERCYAVCTHGEVARAHAPWADKCDACHVPHGEGNNKVNGLFDTHERWHTFRCDTCHTGPTSDVKNYAPHYNRMQKPHLLDDARSHDCSSCHHDHQGSDFALAKVADSDCTRCHKNLTPLHGDGPKITAFHKDHPDFRALAKPPTRGLKFNHALHLARGLTEKDNLGNANATFKLVQVDSAQRGQYERFVSGKSEYAALQLDCTACHEPAGGGYKPVTFDRNCQGCHAQTVAGLQSLGGVTTKQFTVPHGWPQADQDRFIRGEMLRQIDGQREILRNVPLPPADRLDPLHIPRPSDLNKEVIALTELATGLLSCQKCHKTTDGRISPTGTPTLWLPAARFDHTAHRAVNCAVCHKTWEQSPFSRGGPSEPLNVPGIENCKRCHAPSATIDGETRRGVGHACVDCHRYHSGSPKDLPPDGGLPIDSFLRGTPKP